MGQMLRYTARQVVSNHLTTDSPHKTMDGRQMELTRWQSHCADCGAPFELLTPRRNVAVRVDRRRCAEHRDPKRRVKIPAGAEA
jgi:anti-sigma-K factor RskA